MGDRGEAKKAKKQIEKLWHKASKPFQKTGGIVLKIIDDFDRIADAKNKAAVISGLSLFYLALADEYFNVLKNFIVKNLQHPDGRVREAARKTGDWLYVSLTSRAEPFVYPKGKPLTKKQKSEQIIARKQYLDFVAELEALIDRYDDGDENLEYIDEMKPSVNKSLQLLWSRLTDSPTYRKIIEQSRPIPRKILMKRKKIESDLAETLKKAKSDFELDDIKEIIYNEDGQDCLTHIIAMFDRGQGLVELENILEIINDAWNYFPHKILNGFSPAEELLESSEKSERRGGINRVEK